MMKTRSGEQLILGATLFAALGWVASKQVIQTMPAYGFIGLRFLLAGIVLLPLCYKDLRRTQPVTLLKALLVGSVLGVALLIWIYSISISENLAEGAFIMSLAMLFAPLLAWPLYKQKPKRSFWMALPIAIVGMGLLSLTASWQLATSQLLFLISALLLSFHFNLNKQLTQYLKSLPLVCIQLFSIGLVGIVVSFFTEQWSTSFVDSHTLLWFGISVLFATSLRYVLQTQGQKKVSTANASVIMILEPVWTLLLAMVIFGEQLEPQKMLGCGFILLSLFMYRRWEQKLAMVQVSS
ncbi:DMT family transporter [Vibrio sp. Of7-15]|uniref:DMT family transporter n=1 Tax=Vibrio sp. Of7-15 TaxID=2724879 RepID=UPI001EF39C7D|nr:DMT family transporter [Vibrio sp. Of7-15]MCG7495677.1 DMT family transporter [Vibrio sp. Of7-15]